MNYLVGRKGTLEPLDREYNATLRSQIGVGRGFKGGEISTLSSFCQQKLPGKYFLIPCLFY